MFPSGRVWGKSPMYMGLTALTEPHSACTAKTTTYLIKAEKRVQLVTDGDDWNGLFSALDQRTAAAGVHLVWSVVRPHGFEYSRVLGARSAISLYFLYRRVINMAVENVRIKGRRLAQLDFSS